MRHIIARTYTHYWGIIPLWWFETPFSHLAGEDEGRSWEGGLLTWARPAFWIFNAKKFCMTLYINFFIIMPLIITFFSVVDFGWVSLQVAELNGSKGGLDNYSKVSYNHTINMFSASTCRKTLEGILSYFVDLWCFSVGVWDSNCFFFDCAWILWILLIFSL